MTIIFIVIAQISRMVVRIRLSFLLSIIQSFMSGLYVEVDCHYH